MPRFTAILVVAGVLTGSTGGLAGCRPAPRGAPQALSLLGEPLYPPLMDNDTQTIREQKLAQARTAFDRDPQSEEAIIWVGRRLAYLGEYLQAIVMFSYGLEVHPDSYKLLRHRGHRFITTRQLDLALQDLQRASQLIEGVPNEVEPDGLPNRLGIPTSTSHTNIFYHLALAHYLRGQFTEARRAWQQCLDFAENDDMRVAASYWLYLATRRVGADVDANAVLARISADMKIIENHAYHELLLMFRGERSPDEVLDSNADAGPVGAQVDDATRGYGVGAYYLLGGQRETAMAIFRRVIAGPGWPAFGYIAAEAELAREGG